MKKMKKTAAAIVLFAQMVLAAGCWDYKVIDDITVLVGMGIDRHRDFYIVSVEIMKLAGDAANGEVESEVVEYRGKTITDAMGSMMRDFSGEHFLDHWKLLVIGEEAAMEGISHIIDKKLGSTDFTALPETVVARGISAADVLRLKPVNDTIVSIEIKSILDNKVKKLSEAQSMQAHTIKNLLAERAGFALPTISRGEKDGEGVIKANSSAVFKNGKLAGYLSAEESRAWLFATDNVNEGFIVIPPEQGEELDSCGQIIKSKSHVKAHGGKSLRIEMSIQTEISLTENNTTLDFSDKRALESLKVRFEREIGKEVMAVIRRMQREGCDIFGFREMYGMERAPDTEWDELFSEIEVSITSTVNLHDTQLMRSAVK